MDNQYQDIFNDLKKSVEWLDEIVGQLRHRKVKKESVFSSNATDIEKANICNAFDKLDKMNFESIQDLLKLLQSLLRELKQLTTIDD